MMVAKAQSYIFATSYKVYIGHTDAGGIVYHANHLTFFEQCRRDWLAKLGCDAYFMSDELGNKQHFVVSHVDIRYRLPLLLDDKLVAVIEAVQVKSASLVITQSLYRNHQAWLQNQCATSATITLACVCHRDTKLSVCPLPSSLKQAILQSDELIDPTSLIATK